MKNLLLGGTGQIGYGLVQALASSGHDTTVLVRSTKGLSFPASIKVIVEPIFTEQIFERALSGVDCAIYGIGLPEQFTFDSEVFAQVNLGLLRSLLNALQRTPVRRLIYTSSCALPDARNYKCARSPGVVYCERRNVFSQINFKGPARPVEELCATRGSCSTRLCGHGAGRVSWTIFEVSPDALQGSIRLYYLR
jgi:nucleoside-diphosphate-sugar epimerase